MVRFQQNKTASLSIQAETQEIEKKIQDLNNKKSQLEAHKSKINAQIEVIEQAEKSLTGFSEGARFLHSAFLQNRVKGTHQALGNQIQVQAEFEDAISAALGEYLDLMILDEDVDPEAILQFLEKFGKGKVSFLPVKWNQEGDRKIGFPDDPDFIGRAADLIACTDDLKPIVETLLGDILVVRNRQAARRLIQNDQSISTAVTLTGEVFTQQGMVVYGQQNRSGTISRQRQKVEYREALAKLAEQNVTIQSSDKDLRNQLADLQASEKALNNDRRLLEIEHGKISETVNRINLSVDQLSGQIDWLKNQIKTIENEIDFTRKELEQTKAGIIDCEVGIKKHAVQISTLQSKIIELPIEEIQLEVNHWQTEKAVISRALKGVFEKFEDREQVITKNRHRQNGLVERGLEIEANLKSIEKSQLEGNSEEALISSQIQDLQKQLMPSQEELKVKEQQSEELEQFEASSQQSLSLVERYYSQAQTEMIRQREALELLRRRIEDDFGLVAFEYEATVSGPTPLPFEGMVEQLPVVRELPQGLEDNITRQKNQLRRMGAINPEALAEYKEVKDRYQFITGQVADLRNAEGDLRQVISELDELMKRDFRNTFNAVAGEFHQMFKRLFDGGSARLILDDEDNLNQTGIEIEAKLPGKREQGLSLLSGGERSLTAAALIFALLKVSPTPFCVMDEVDAMLDEANVARFCSLLTEQSKTTQFVVITHNRNTVRISDVVYGITMGKDSSSQVVSLKFDEVPEELAS